MVIMIFALILYLSLGAMFYILGLLLWKKQKVTLIHTYHYKNVRRDDIPAYTRLMGISLIVMGVGCCLAGLMVFIDPLYSTLSVIAGIIVGILLMNKAQKKYNGSWFS